MFRTDLLSVIGVDRLAIGFGASQTRSVIGSLNTAYTAIGICHVNYVDCQLARSEWNLTSLAESQHNWHDKIPIAVYTVLRLPTTGSISVQNMYVKFFTKINKFEK